MSFRTRAQIVISLVLLILVLTVAAQNQEKVAFHFLFWSVTVDRFLLIFGNFLLGGAVGLGLGYFWWRPRKKA